MTFEQLWALPPDNLEARQEITKRSQDYWRTREKIEDIVDMAGQNCVEVCPASLGLRATDFKPIILTAIEEVLKFVKDGGKPE